MLLSLEIENFALIDRLKLDFGASLNVLTGETGAGKSIILDAIDAILGGRVTRRAIRTGASRARLVASFQMDASLLNWFHRQSIPTLAEQVLVCSREVTVVANSTRSRLRVNGVLVNRRQLEDLRSRLVEITAQGQTVQLGQAGRQREWLDQFGGITLLQQRGVVTRAFEACQQARKILDERRRLESERLQQLDLFEYQLKELEAASLNDPKELDTLEQESQRLSHSVELQQHSYQVYQTLYENEAGAASADLLGKAEAILNDMVRYDSELQGILDLVSSALAQVEEAGQQINAYGESVETDPQRLQLIQARIQELKQICRKYGPTLADAIAYQARLQNELEQLNGKGQSLEALEVTYRERQETFQRACAQLTQLRQQAAEALQTRLVHELKPLAMEKVQFRVEVTPTTPTANGADQVTFQFSPNPGEPLQPLAETASGGEMSRFLLALKACFSQVDPVGTLIFDEIDVGVSGRVAQAIAEKLHQLGHHHQVLCVTHQPLVAAMADSHFRVSKEMIDCGNASREPLSSASETRKPRRPRTPSQQTAGSVAESGAIPDASRDVRTVVRVSPLDELQRREELAQLAGGGQSAQEAIAFAESLLSQADSLRKAKT